MERRHEVKTTTDSETGSERDLSVLEGTDGLTCERAKSLVLHRAVRAELETDPDRVLAIARRNLARYREIHGQRGGTYRYFDQWEQILDSGPEGVPLALADPGEVADGLRQSSPFAGVLPEEQRPVLLARFVD
jgi:hypothetical protein